jgi:hypothetical protein
MSIFAVVHLLPLLCFSLRHPTLRSPQKDLRYYETTMEAIAQNSPDAQVFCLLHKMDLIAEDARDRVFAERSDGIRSRSLGIPVSFFRTSIWDETLYKAWSTIVYSLIPNVRDLETHLREFADMCDADEVVLFERSTFLVISNATRRPHADMHRFEKISNIVKQFKLSCTCVPLPAVVAAGIAACASLHAHSMLWRTQFPRPPRARITRQGGLTAGKHKRSSKACARATPRSRRSSTRSPATRTSWWSRLTPRCVSVPANTTAEPASAQAGCRAAACCDAGSRGSPQRFAVAPSPRRRPFPVSRGAAADATLLNIAYARKHFEALITDVA